MYQVAIHSVFCFPDSYDEGNIVLQWATRNGTTSPVHLDDEVSLPQFEITRIRTSEFSRLRRGLGMLIYC